MVPSRVENRNVALAPFGRSIPVVPAVVTEPEGEPIAVESPEAAGTTTLNRMVPGVGVAATTKLRPEPGVLIHHVPLTEIAQGLTKSVSVKAAGTEPSEMRLVTLYAPPVCAAVGRVQAATNRVRAATIPATVRVDLGDMSRMVVLV